MRLKISLVDLVGDFRKLLIGTVLAGLLVPALAAQERTGATESKIIALEKAWNQAYKFRDKKALDEILSDSIILVNDDGSVLTKATFLASVDSASSSDDQQAEPESITVHVSGDVAIASGIFRIRGVEKGKPYARRNRFVDTWVSTGRTWVCVSGSATPVLH